MTQTSPKTDAAKANPMRRVFALRDFRLLFAGSALSLLGDQFTLIATPWLVLQLTGDPLVLGIVLALEGLPRAAFMLVGGAITDRLSPRRIMLISDAIRLILTALMAAAVLTGAVQVWMLYGFSLGFGLVAGFAMPAQNSIVPMLVEDADLQAGNSAIMGLSQVAGFVGPSLAGVVIGAHTHSLGGIGEAYTIDAFSFAASALCLFLIRGGGLPKTDEAPEEGVLAAIKTAFAYIWDDAALRLVFLLLAAVNFLLMGPLTVGMPLLAKTRLPEGALAYGMLISAFSAGNLLGFLIAGTSAKPGAGRIKMVLVGVLIAFAAMVGVLGFITQTWVDIALLFGVGIGNGYLAILLFTWMQSRAPKKMLGRIMSFLLFANTGLVPISQSLSGALGSLDLNALLLAAGGLSAAVTLWAVTRPELTDFCQSLAAMDKTTEGSGS